MKTPTFGQRIQYFLQVKDFREVHKNYVSHGAGRTLGNQAKRRRAWRQNPVLRPLSNVK